MTCARSYLAPLALALAGLSGAPASAAPWPLVDPATGAPRDGKVLATFDYTNHGTATYIHEGVDIAALSKSAVPPGPAVVAVMAGTVANLKNTNSYDDFVAIKASDGRCWLYLHLDGVAVALDQNIVVGDRLADAVVAWPFCTGYGHLHLEISEPGEACSDPLVATTRLVAPLGEVEPVLQDDLEPVVEEVVLCADGGACDGPAGTGCDPTPKTCLDITRGNLDVVAEIHDLFGTRFMRSVGDVIAPKLVRWRSCPESSPDCSDWQTPLRLEWMDPNWVDKVKRPAAPLFDTLGTCVSNGEYCLPIGGCPPAAQFCSRSGQRFRYVLTNFDASMRPSTSGFWDTHSLDGHYTIAVEANDYGGNVGLRSVPVCLHAANSCPAKLTVRDCVGDNGAEPSSCDVGWLSPDIIGNPDGAGQPGPAIAAGGSNTIRVCATNTGCAAIPPGDSVTFALDWASTTAGIAFPIGAQGGTAVAGSPVLVSTLRNRLGSPAPSSDWPVGEERCLDLTWTPTDPGHVCLVARVSHDTDAPTPTPGVTLDNNRAQHNFVVAETIETPSVLLAAAAFYLSPLPEVESRTVVLQVDPARSLGRSRVRVQLATAAAFARVAGGRVAGFVSRDSLARWERREPLEACERTRPADEPCLLPDRSVPSDLAVVEVDPRSAQLVFSAVVVDRPSIVEMFARWEGRAGDEPPLEIRVSERVASPSGTGTIEIGGLTILVGSPSGVPDPR